jgi:hypothetical protein
MDIKQTMSYDIKDLVIKHPIYLCDVHFENGLNEVNINDKNLCTKCSDYPIQPFIITDAMCNKKPLENEENEDDKDDEEVKENKIPFTRMAHTSSIGNRTLYTMMAHTSSVGNNRKDSSCNNCYYMYGEAKSGYKCRECNKMICAKCYNEKKHEHKFAVVKITQTEETP